jgi:ADP-ribose pyrophosphatase
MQLWKTLSRHTVLERGKFLIENWPWVITPDYVNIVAIAENARFLCFRQNKYSIEGMSLAPVGGYIDPGEDPLTAAKRELLEETGYQASEWIELAHLPIDGNRGVGTAHLFLARGASRVADIDADDLEDQELVFLSQAEVEAALDAGEFKLLPWATAVALALRRLDKDPP